MESRFYTPAKRFFHRHPTPIAILIIAASVALAQGPEIRSTIHQRHWEDSPFLQHIGREIHSWSDCFTKPSQWPGLYRPLTTNCYYYICQNYLGGRIIYLKATNVAIYVANAVLLFLIAQFLLPPGWALLAAVIFATRSVHATVLAATPAFQSLFAVFLSFWMIYFFLRGRSKESKTDVAVSCLLFVPALLSKETAVVVPLVLAVYGWLFDARRAWRWYVVPAAIAATWAVLFALVLRNLGDTDPIHFRFTLSLWTVLGNYATHFLDSWNFLVYPAGDGSVLDRIDILVSHRAVLVAFLALVVAEVWLLVRSPRQTPGRSVDWRVVAFGLAVFFVSMAPYAFFQTRLLARYSYVGHAGLALAAAVLCRFVAAALVSFLRGFNRPDRSAGASYIGSPRK